MKLDHEAESVVTQLKREIDLVDLIGESVRLKRSGSAHVGLCPFHEDKKPSFAVYDDNYHCFGCGAHGDAISWIQHEYGDTFPEACQRLGYPLPRSERKTLRVKPLPSVKKKAAQKAKETELVTFSRQDLKDSLGLDENNLFIKAIVNRYGREQAAKMQKEMLFGTVYRYDKPYTVFWHVKAGQILTGKLMLFGHIDEHGQPKRDRETKLGTTWYHAGKIDRDTQHCETWFPFEWLLEDEAKGVVLVESEKTAVFMNVEQPNWIWLPFGKGLPERFRPVLEKRSYFGICPDTDVYRDPEAKRKHYGQIRSYIGFHKKVTALVHWIQDVPEGAKADVLDWVFEYRDKGVTYPKLPKEVTKAPEFEAAEPEPEELSENEMLKALARKHQILKSLKEKLKLKKCGALEVAEDSPLRRRTISDIFFRYHNPQPKGIEEELALEYTYLFERTAKAAEKVWGATP